MPQLRIPRKSRCLNAIYFRLHSTDFSCLFRFLDYFVRRILGRFLVLLVYGLIGFVAFTSATIVLPFEAMYKPRWLIIALALFALYLLGNVLFHYYKANTTHAGNPPKVLREPLCRYCHGYKPYGTHHCAICNECILRMDHHCVWINRCVGAANHRHFLQFLAFLIAGCWTFVGAAGNTFYYNYWHSYTSAEFCTTAELESLPWFDTFCSDDSMRFVSSAVFFTYGLCIIIAMLVGGLCYWNFILISAGMTYIEMLQRQIGWRKMMKIIFCPLSAPDFAANWRAFLGLKRDSGRTFFRHILFPSSHSAFVYEEEFAGLLADERAGHDYGGYRRSLDGGETTTAVLLSEVVVTSSTGIMGIMRGRASHDIAII